MSASGRERLDALRDAALARWRDEAGALAGGPRQDSAVIETHISWLLLVGDEAFKIKKPLRLPFLDFSTLALRRAACQDELRLNLRFAPDLYRAVVTITDAGAGRVAIDGSGPVLEYAVHMRRFEQADLLSELAARGQLGADIIDRLAARVEAAHDHAPRLPDGAPWGAASEVWVWVAENFESLRGLPVDPTARQSLAWLEAWTQAEHARVAPHLDARRAAGMVRECHGDLHLGNIVLLGGRPWPFDCIEFNPALRWLDPMSDVAFLIMDLRERGLGSLAWRFASAYLQHGGDYEGLRVLRYFAAYRALVRAKVTALRLTQPGMTDAGLDRARSELATYIGLAEGFARERRPLLLLTHGLSGSGKSHLAAGLVERLGLLQLRSDLERKRLFGLASSARSGSPLDAGIYTPEATRVTYDRLAALAGMALDEGYPVLVDATFLRRAERERFRGLAAERGADSLILDLEAPLDCLAQRLRARAAEGRDASEADLAVLHRQLERREPLDASERARAIGIDSALGNAVEQAADGVLARHPELRPAPD